MNKYFIATIAAITMVGCRQHNDVNEQDESRQPDVQAVESSESVVTERRQVPYIGDFFQITNMSDFDIEFTQGDFNVEVEAPAAAADVLRTSFDSGIITFSQPEGDRHTIYTTNMPQSIGTIHVSCPNLKVVAVCGKGCFRSTGPIHSSSLHIGLLSTADISLDSVVCDDFFKYETSDDGSAIFSYVKAGGDLTLLASNNGHTTAYVCSDGALLVNTGGNGQNTITAQAPTSEITAMDASTCNLTIDTDSLMVYALGESKISLGGNIRKKEIKRSSKATVTER